MAEEPANEIVHRQPDIDRTSDSFPILFNEIACASASRADDRFRIQVTETEATIDVAVSITQKDGEQSCPGNPWTPAIVELASPIGDREIRGVALPVDDAPSPLTVIASSGRELPTDWIFTDVETPMAIYSEARCEDLDVPFGAEFIRPGPHVSYDSLLADAVTAIDAPTQGWFRSQAPDGSTIAVQFYKSIEVGVISLYRKGPGWSVEAIRCSDLPAGWQPDLALPDPEGRGRTPAPGTPARQEDLDRARDIIASLPSIVANGTGFEFLDADVRCPAMTALEDALHARGFIVRTTTDTIDEQISQGDNQLMERQTQTILATPDGGAISIQTALNGTLELELLPSAYSGSPGHSSIEPCFLDTPATVNVQPAP